jgi:hypothetical protein
MTQIEIKERIRFFQLNAVFLAEENEHITCLKYLFLAEFYKDFLEA